MLQRCEACYNVKYILFQNQSGLLVCPSTVSSKYLTGLRIFIVTVYSNGYKQRMYLRAHTLMLSVTFHTCPLQPDT